MNAQENYKKGLELLEKGDYNQAHDYLIKALDLAPDNPDIISDLGVVYFHQHKNELAMIFLNRALELDPANGYRYSSRAYVKDKFGDVEGAIEDYKKAIEIDPEDAISYNNLGLAEEKLGHIERAKMRFKKADELREKQEHLQEINKDEEKKEEFVMIQSSRTEIEEEIIEEPTETKGKIIKGVFTSKKGFKEFIRFIFNGFRLKE